MRTTVRLKADVLGQLRVMAAETGQSITGLIEDAVRDVFARRRSGRADQPKVKLPSFKGNGLQAQISLEKGSALRDFMDDLR